MDLFQPIISNEYHFRPEILFRAVSFRGLLLIFFLASFLMVLCISTRSLPVVTGFSPSSEQKSRVVYY